MLGVALGSVVTVWAGVPWTMYIARRHTPPDVWTTPLFHETTRVMTLLWALIFLGAAGITAVTPWWVQGPLGVAMYLLGRLSPWMARHYATWRQGRLDAARLGAPPPP